MPRYIDAYLAEEKINQWIDQTGAITPHTSYHGELIGCIEDTPTADVAPVVHAHWTSKEEKWYDGETYCSACGGEAGAEYGRYTYLETEYCPYCGARMDEREEK